MICICERLNPNRLQLQFSRSLSTGNAPANVCHTGTEVVGQRNISPSEYAPGSPYRTTSSTAISLTTSDPVGSGVGRSYLNSSTGKEKHVDSNRNYNNTQLSLPAIISICF